MTIKDFEEKVKIGGLVVHRKKLYLVADRDLRTHEVILKGNHRVRCSEVELPSSLEPRKVGRPKKETNPASQRNRKLKTKRIKRLMTPLDYPIGHVFSFGHTWLRVEKAGVEGCIRCWFYAYCTNAYDMGNNPEIDLLLCTSGKRSDGEDVAFVRIDESEQEDEDSVDE